ncbi:MAG: hypothetical protein Q4C14_03870 [Bacillota bacterium]|nr:hypothetical protein [Bacillota bacterium]
MTPLGALLVLFAGMSVMGIIGAFTLFLVKNAKAQKIIFYIMAVYGMIIAWMNADSLPENFIGEQLIAWGLGLPAAAAVVIALCSRSEKAFVLAKILAVVSVLGGMLDLFVF